MISRAEIIAVGSELLTPSRLDTNSLFITERLNEVGIDVRAKAVVGDDPGDLAALLRQALARADLVVLTGGLGPTDDDITREVVAEVLGLPLEEHVDIVDRIRQRFESRGLRMPEINRRQGMVPRGAKPLDNPNGTAPGLWIVVGEKRLLLVPGPPREMTPLVDRIVKEELSRETGGRRLFRRVLKIAGRTESHVEEVSQPVYSRWRSADPPIVTTILAAPGQVELHLTVQAADETRAREVLDSATGELAAALGIDLYSIDGRSLEEVVGHLLRARGLRIAVAESCTGGLVTSRLTDVPGSSDYVDAGVVAYNNQIKIDVLGVPATMIAEHGAVSEPVAVAMAEGVRKRTGSDVGVGVTGIAGPGGGSVEKPVGTVVLAVVAPDGKTRARTVRFPGGRAQVKFQASQAALEIVRRMLLR